MLERAQRQWRGKEKGDRLCDVAGYEEEQIASDIRSSSESEDDSKKITFEQIQGGAIHRTMSKEISDEELNNKNKMIHKAPDWVDESVSRNVADVTNRRVASTNDLAFGGNVLLDAIDGRRRTDHRRMTGALPDDATSTLGTNRRLINNPAHTGGLRKNDVSSEKLQSSNKAA